MPMMPSRCGMFPRIQEHRGVGRNPQAENPLAVVPYTGRIAVLPGRVDGVDVLQRPVLQQAAGRLGIDAGFFPHLAHCGLAPGLAFMVLAARHRLPELPADRKSTRLNSSHSQISYAVFCLKKKKTYDHNEQDNGRALYVVKYCVTASV